MGLFGSFRFAFTGIQGMVCVNNPRDEVLIMATIIQPEASARNRRHYKESVRLNTREVVRRLNGALGGTLVSTLAGAKDPKSASKWAKEDGAVPRDEATKRLHFAYEKWQEIASAEGEHVARVWFIGANPWLNYETPVMAIREGQYQEVSIAAQALVDDSFNG